MNKRMMGLGLCATLVGGCMLPAEPATEDSGASVSVGGKTLWISTTDYGWEGYEDVEDTVWVTRDDASWGGFSDGTQVTMEGTRYAFAEWTRNYGTVDVIELEAKVGFWRGISTDLAIALYHRQSGSRTRWLPVDCGLLPDNQRLRRTDLEYYEPKDLLIDLDYQEIQARAMDTDREETVDFYSCGVTESRPEFAAFVFPRYNWGNMEDEYKYTLKAWCDGGDCPEYEGDPTEPYNSSRNGSRTDSRYGSSTDCRDPRADRNCANTRDSRDTRDTRDTRDSTRYAWSASSSGALYVEDDDVACQSISVNSSGDARNVVLTLRGYHDYPRVLEMTLGHNRQVMDVRLDSLPESGDFQLTAAAVYGFTGEARGTWKLCVEDTDTRHTDEGQVTSWTIQGR